MPEPENPSNIKALKDALKDFICSITIANGYSLDLLRDHILTTNDRTRAASQDISDYPKIFITLAQGRQKRGASRQYDRFRRFAITIILRELFVDDPANPPSDFKSVSERIDSLVDDLEKAALLNPALDDKVDTFNFTDFDTDADNAYPEGILVCYFNLDYRSHG